MATDDSTHTLPFGKLTDIPFRSDSAHEKRFASGTLCAFEDVVAGAIVILVTPAAIATIPRERARPVRLLLDFDSALEAAHALIAAAARLRRAEL